MDEWIADAVGKMHIHRIEHKKLADHIGWNPKYLSVVLNGHKTPKGARERIEKAIDEIIAEKAEN